MSKKLISVVELPEFLKFSKRHLDDEKCIEIVNFIAANPTNGDVIPGSGGVRKIRFTANDKGKSGGIRLIYYYYNDDIPVFLITGFLKSEMENINKSDCNELKKLTDDLVKLYKKKEGKRE